MKTLLVTGAAGFIGSHLVDRLLREGNRVVGIDNLLTGSKQNIMFALKHPNFTFIKQDIIDPILVRGGIDEIYNLACPASPEKYQADSIHTIQTSTIGVMNMLELARKKKAKILQASTSEVYGDPEIHPQVESYKGNVNPIGPRACYDEGKRIAETLCFEYRRVHQVLIKVVRIFNTYGPRMAYDDGRVVSNFIWAALHGKPITIYGDGSQTRSFCYVDDLVEGLIRMMESGTSVTGPINLGNPDEFTVAELAKKIQVMIGGKSVRVYKKLPIDDPKLRKPDITLAKKKIRWTPKVSLDEGLKKTIDYFKTQV